MAAQTHCFFLISNISTYCLVIKFYGLYSYRYIEILTLNLQIHATDKLNNYIIPVAVWETSIKTKIIVASIYSLHCNFLAIYLIILT